MPMNMPARASAKCVSHEPLPALPSRRGDLHWWYWASLPVLVVLLVIFAHYLSPELYELMTRRDEAGFGVVENLTVLVLLPAIVAGFMTFRDRRLFPDWRLGWTTLSCTLACIYFAGEELSWGQHLFGWQTPESFAAANKQRETNLHNLNGVGGWFNQKPKMLVEWWLLLGGVLLPAARWLRRARPGSDTLMGWFWPTHIVVPTALLYLAMRSAYWYQDGTGVEIPWWAYDPETREFLIALYLSLYLTSIRERLKAKATLLDLRTQPFKRGRQRTCDEHQFS